VGASIVASVCDNLGHTVDLVDLNIKFYHLCKQQDLDYHKFDMVWDKYAEPTTEQSEFIDNFIDSYIANGNLDSYDHVMISVFGMSNHFFAERFLKKISVDRTFRILVGGTGAFISIKGQGIKPFAEAMQEQGLIDDYIKGEAEHALLYYLRGESYPGINNTNPAQIDDLDSLPIVNYSFVNLDEYDYLEGMRDVYIEGSRGCVRKCSYCDVAAFWPKYRYRSGQHIAKEIIANYEQFGIKRFYFTDSLVNGSLSAFYDMCNVLSNYQYSNQIKWGGQFIFRNQRTVPPEHFEMIAKAGGNIFYVGVETGSDRIRKEMGKNFTNEDIEYQLDQFHKNGLKCTFLMFPGYVTETVADHQATLDMFPRWQKYVASGTINGLELGTPLIVLENTPLSRRIEEYGLEFLHSDNIITNHYWQSRQNPGFDFVQRVHRQLELYEAAAQYHWPIWRFDARTIELKQSLLEFYSIRQSNPKYQIIPIKS
jgi:hypothetical protein